MRISVFKDDCVDGNKYVYPVTIHKVADGYIVDLVDFDCSTEATTIPEAIFMARDAIKLLCEDMIADGKEVPLPFSNGSFDMSGLLTLVDVELNVSDLSVEK